MDRSDTQDVVVVGAGPAGLTAALELLRRTGLRPIVFEADTQVGGISKTVEYRGNRMDLGGHRFFSKSDWVMNWWQDILPVEVDPESGALDLSYQNQHLRMTPSRVASPGRSNVMLVRQRLSRILYGRKFYDYPLKLTPRTLANLGAGNTLAIGASYLRSRLWQRTPEVTLEDFLVNRFGWRLYQTFFRSYTEKVWGVPCNQISAEWGAQRIKGLSVSRALAHALRSLLPRRETLAQQDVETSLIEKFLYPRLGPGQMWEEVAARVVTGGGELHLSHEVVGVRRDGRHVVGVDVRDKVSGQSRTVPCRHLVSTMPIGTLAGHLGGDGEQIGRIASGLPHRDFMTAGLLLKRMRSPSASRRGTDSGMPPDNWIYVQEEDVRMGRIQIFNNWSPHLVRDPGTVWLGLEYFCQSGDGLWSMPDAAFLDLAARELEQVGLADRRDVLDGTVVRVPKAYPAYFGQYQHMPQLRDWISQFENVFPIGRNGMHRYNNQDHSMLAARAAVDCIEKGSPEKDALWAVNTEDDYHEERRTTGTADTLPGVYAQDDAQESARRRAC